MGESVIIRPRLQPDMDACVSLLRQLHEHDNYPLTWPADPHAWLCGNRQAIALYQAQGWRRIGSVHYDWLPQNEQSLLFAAPPERAAGRLKGKSI